MPPLMQSDHNFHGRQSTRLLDIDGITKYGAWMLAHRTVFVRVA
jgi:hypothetical protein